MRYRLSLLFLIILMMVGMVAPLTGFLAGFACMAMFPLGLLFLACFVAETFRPK